MSDHRSVSVQDRRVAPTQPGHRSARRAASPPPPPEDLPRGRRGSGGQGGGRMRVLAWVSIVMTTVLAAGALTGYAYFRNTLGGIPTKPVDIRGDRPTAVPGALNVLLVGSDTRHGDGNAKYGQADARIDSGKRTDTMILLHISPGGEKASLISFPRDSIVQIPSCARENGGADIPPRVAMINSAYNDGGISCTMSTIEKLTGIRINHFVEIDFNGFKGIVDAMGGIEMCFSKPIDDKKAKFHITAGTHTLNGEQALGFVRLRSVGDGSDLSRIKRQQKFLINVVKKATSSKLLTDVPMLNRLITSATKSVTMDEDLAGDPTRLIEIATNAKSLTASGVKMIMVPVEAYPGDANRVQWRQPAANELFNAIKSDVDIPEPTPTPTGTAAVKKTLKPSQVRVQVLNGTNTRGEAQRVADELTKQGFTVVGLGNAPAADGKSQPTSLIKYAKSKATDVDYAAVLAGKLLTKVTPEAGKIKVPTPQPYVPGVAVTKTTDKGPIVQLIIGSDFKGVKASTEIPDSVKNETITADEKNICT